MTLRLPQLEAAPSSGWIRRAGVFAVVLLVGWFAWHMVGGPFTAAFEGLSSATLGSFGSRGHAHFFRPDSARASDAERDASWDLSVQLQIDGTPKTHTVSLNPRRLAYLPLLFFTAFVAASPLSWRRKGICLALGNSGLFLVALGSAWITIAWLFARVPGLVYDLSPLQASSLHLLYEGFVTPIANKFIVPLFLASALVSWQLARAGTQRATKSEPVESDVKPSARTPRSRRRNQRRKRS